MTCIAGLTDGKTCAIAGDSGLFEDGDTNIWWPTVHSKVWRIGNALLGACGGSATEIAQSSKIVDPLKLAEYLKEKQVKDDDPDWDIIIVTRRGLWVVSDDYTAHKMKRGYHAIGAAAGPAWGALHVAKHLKLPPIEAVRLAVQAACDTHIYAVAPVVAKEIT
jgi:hypothetical protein